jgi:hypothetical protein
MAVAAVNFIIDKGTDFSTAIKIKTDGSVVNLTGYAFSCVMRKHYNSPVGYGFSTTILSPAADGIVKLELHNSVTTELPIGRHVFDLISITPSTNIKTKVLEGNVLVRGSSSNDRG